MAHSRTFRLEAGGTVSIAAHVDEAREKGELLADPAKVFSFVRIRAVNQFFTHSSRQEQALDFALSLDEARDVATCIVEAIEEALDLHYRVEKINEQKIAEAARGAASRNDAEGEPVGSAEV